ncbi:MAG: hypothetical protein DHS20C11_26280 [Lysobacteraceae bacterium]|nr:MAG: hypothetical protein DHS20C11_26280 [Xanthomonadaceae bacterium]
MFKILAPLLLLITAHVVFAGEPDLVRKNNNDVAIDGYSPVSYFQRGKPEQGSADFSSEFQGATYWLTDAEQLVLFEASPEKYIPAHGGWCSLMLSGSGRLSAANPNSFKIVDNRLLLFWAGDFNGQQISGLANWESKGPDQKTLKKADKQWQKLLSGKSDAEIIVFADHDYARLSDQDKAVAIRHQ